MLIWCAAYRWNWRGHAIRYTATNISPKEAALPAVVFIHGFGGNADHWRSNLRGLPMYSCFALDLLGV
jgi:pimeloyl-ACP methyl ester carboxylesterase